MKHSSTFIILIALLLLAAQCQFQPTDLSAETLEGTGSSEAFEPNQAPGKEIELSAIKLEAGEKLKVVATTNIIGDLVSNVGGDLIDLTVMLPLGADIHTFSPTPSDAALVADAHVVFINGLNLEEFLGELIKNAGGEAIIVPVATGVEAHEFNEGNIHAHSRDGETDQAAHNLRRTDPHIWMSPANAIVMVHNIEHALSKLDPANAKTYQANAVVYVAKLEELDKWVKAQIEGIPATNRQLVTDHDAFGYYADRYGLEVVGAVIPAYSTNAEPSARELAELQKAIKEFKVKAVFVGTSVNPVLAKQVAQDMGIKLVPLYTGSLGEPGSGAETYIDFVRYNTTAIADALK